MISNELQECPLCGSSHAVTENEAKAFSGLIAAVFRPCPSERGKMMKRFVPALNGTAFMGMRSLLPDSKWGGEGPYYLCSDIDKCGPVVEEPVEGVKAAEKPPEDAVAVPVEKLLYMRDCLIRGDVDEAYHTLYGLASPNFDKFSPWSEWEALVPRSPVEEVKE